MRVRRRSSFAVFMVLIGSLVSAPATAQAGPDELASVERLQNVLAAVADRVRSSVVVVRASRRFDVIAMASPSATSLPAGPGRRLPGPVIPSVGSGVIITTDGLILTNEHVVHGVEPDAIECILSSGERYTVQGMTSDPRSDLAVLSIDAGNLTPATLGNAAALKQGHFVIVLGNPFGSATDAQGKPAMSFGVVSALHQDLTEKLDPQRYYGNLIQTDAKINPGNSGGPLLNLKGEVVGIATAIASHSGGSEGIGYAIPITTPSRRTIECLSDGATVEYGYLGVRLDERHKVGPAGRDGKEVVVIGIDAGTPAAAAGIRPNDVVVSFDREPVRGLDELVAMVAVSRAATPVPISILRDGKAMTLEVTPVLREDVPAGVNIEPPLSWRGATFANLSPQNRRQFGLPDSARGVVVTAVTSGGAAEKAGLRPGEVIRRLGTSEIRGLRRLRQLTASVSGPAVVVLSQPTFREIRIP